jgi:flagellar biosynthesis protein FlhF
MQLYTFKARSLADAIRLVRQQLGPDASLLHTREIGSPLLRFLGGGTIEVTASDETCAPSRLPPLGEAQRPSSSRSLRTRPPAAEVQNYRNLFRQNLASDQIGGVPLVEGP